MLEDKVPEELELHISDPEEKEPEEESNEELVPTPSTEKKESEEDVKEAEIVDDKKENID